jgi:GNAT superfamily N-acetyltransferase
MSKEKFTLHSARPEDVGEIVAFIRELAEYEKLSNEMIATEESIGEWLFGQQPAAEVIIARIARQPAGFALFFTSFSTFLGRPGIYLEDLFVRPEFRGQGIGKGLLQHLAGIACQRGYGRLEWAVLDWNEPSIKFYEQMGAVAMNDWITYRVSGAGLRLMAQATG